MKLPTVKKPNMKNLQDIYRAALILITCGTIAACSQSKLSGGVSDGGPTGEVDLSHIQNAIPKDEIYSRYGNHSPYKVFEKEYKVMDSNIDFEQEGIASWYGTKFHGALTSNREAYDMYAMTAAHKTLPLPSYVQVTNLENGNEIIVKVNDRGPFKEGRIIDLSYAAAHKLDMHEQGTAHVKIKVLPPFLSKPASPAALKTNYTFLKNPHDFPKDKTNYLQIGVFSNEEAAQNLQVSLVKAIQNSVLVISNTVQAGKKLYKVRIGPIQTLDNLVSIQNVLIERNLPHYYLISE